MSDCQPESDKQDTELTTLCYENKARVMFLYIDSIYCTGKDSFSEIIFLSTKFLEHL